MMPAGWIFRENSSGPFFATGSQRYRDILFFENT